MTRALSGADHGPVTPERKTEESGRSALQVVAAQRIAQATLTGFGLCEDSGLALNERQKVALLTAAMLEVDGLQDELAGVLHVERLIAELGGFDRS